MSSDPYAVLGISARGVTVDAVRKAYAARLKQIRPDEDPAGFMALREAFEHARVLASIAERKRIRQRRPKAADEVASSSKDNDVSASSVGEFDVPDPGAAPAAIEPVKTVLINEHPVDRVTEAFLDLINRADKPDLAEFRTLLDRDDIHSVDEFRDLDERLRWIVMQRSGFGARPEPQAEPWMTAEVLELFDERFGWFSGGAQRRQGQADAFWLNMLYDEVGGIRPQRINPAVATVEVSPRLKWFVHPAFVIGVGYLYVWLFRLDERTMPPKVVVWFALARLFLGILGLIWFALAKVAFEDLFRETVRHLRNRFADFRGRRRKYVSWMTERDVGALIITVIVIVLIELSPKMREPEQPDPHPLPAEHPVPSN